MKIAGAFAMAIGIYGFLAAPKLGNASEIRWVSSIEQGLDEKGAEGKPIFAYFTAEWCLACKEMEIMTLRDPAIVAILNDDFVPVKIDCTTNSPETQKILEKYGIAGFPSFVILSDENKIEQSSTGFLDKKEMLSFIGSAGNRR